MAKILVSAEGVASLRTTAQKLQAQNQNNAAEISSILSQLDFEASSAEEIKQRARSLQKRLTQQAEKMERYTGILQQVNDRFDAADKKVSKEADAIRNAPVISQVVLDQIKSANDLLNFLVPPLEIQHAEDVWGNVRDLFPNAVGNAFTSIALTIAGIADKIFSAVTNPTTSETIYQNLQEHDPVGLFGQYDFQMHFINDLGFFDVIGYGLVNWKETAKALLEGTFFGSDVAEAFMNDPDKCSSFLRRVIDDLCDTEYLDVFSSDTEEAMGIIGDLAEACGYGDASDFLDAINGYVGDAETVDKMMKDYSANISMLESLRSLSPESSVLSETIDHLMAEYQDQARAMLMDDIKAKAEEGLIDMVDYVTGSRFGAVDTVIQTVLGDAPAMGAMDSVIYTSSMRSDAIIAFQDAAKIIQSGNYTEADMNRYKISFDTAKSLTIEQYEGILSYYDSDSQEARYLRNQLNRLESMSYDDFNYATSFSDYKSGAGGGGGGRGGRGF